VFVLLVAGKECVAACCSELQLECNCCRWPKRSLLNLARKMCIAACCSVLQRVAVSVSGGSGVKYVVMLQVAGIKFTHAACCSMLQCVAM